MMENFKLITLFVMLINMANAQQSGTLDPTFGTNGMVQTFFGVDNFRVDVVRGICIQPDGKIVAAGTIASTGKRKMGFVRYNTDGNIDPSFGQDGQVVIPGPSGLSGYVMDFELLPSGKFISLGYSFDPDASLSRPLLVKLNADGTIDNSFGNNGVALGIFAQSFLPEKMRIQSDGKIVFAGYCNDNLAVCRYNADGSIDTGFGNAGLNVLLLEGSINSTFAKDLALQADGKIVVAGTYYLSSRSKCLVARFNPDGSLDNNFGESGILKISVGEGHDFLSAVEMQNDGKIVLVGHSWDKNTPKLQYSVAVVRINSNGTFDTQFGQNGVFRQQLIEVAENYSTAMAINPGGSIYVAISIVNGNTFDMGLMCLNSHGELHTQFSQTGFSINDVAQDDATCIALQTDGKVLVGGKASVVNQGTPFTLLRYLSDVPLTIDNSVCESTVLFRAYPTPVNDILNIDYEGLFTVQIFDLSGRLLLAKENNRSVDVSALPAGTYVIKLNTETGILTERFVKL